MNALNFISYATKIALGWTLLHTLWQGALLLIALRLIQWVAPTLKSSVKYLLNCSALALLLVISFGTFLYLYDETGHLSIQSLTSQHFYYTFNFSAATASSYWNEFVQQINFQIPWIITAWLIGVLIFSMRFTIGLLYIRFLKSDAIAVNAFWNSQLILLSHRIGIKKWIALVESVHIDKPIVVGYLKPMILLPIGLLSGLPYDQIEAILLHELSHIKRYDYLINLIQSIIEIVLFFNPFVWIISKMIREEREHCCDDAVLCSGSTRITYAMALAQLEVRRSQHTPDLALALNKNKYHVLKRIKRIMETSVKNNEGKSRPLAIITIVITALICASWLGIERNSEMDHDLVQKSGNGIIAADTIKDNNKSKEKDKNKKETSATYSRQSITTYDEDGTPHEEVIEKFEGDEELRPMMADPGSYSSAIPSIPAIPALPSIPAIPAIPAIPFDYNYTYDGDTIPGNHFFSDEDREKWEEFGKEMAKRFEHFGEENEEFGELMEQWADEFGHKFSFQFNENFQDQMDRLHEKLGELHNNKEFKEKLDLGLKDMEQQLKRLEETLQEHKKEFRHIEADMQKYEAEMQEQLVKDGYLKKGEKLNSLNWEDGKLTVNGTKIKDKDISKYEAIKEKHFKHNRQ